MYFIRIKDYLKIWNEDSKYIYIPKNYLDIFTINLGTVKDKMPTFVHKYGDYHPFTKTAYKYLAKRLKEMARDEALEDLNGTPLKATFAESTDFIPSVPINTVRMAAYITTWNQGVNVSLMGRTSGNKFRQVLQSIRGSGWSLNYDNICLHFHHSGLFQSRQPGIMKFSVGTEYAIGDKAKMYFIEKFMQDMKKYREYPLWTEEDRKMPVIVKICRPSILTIEPKE